MYFPAEPLTDLQKLARSSTGETVPIFGRDLFEHVPSTFAPADQIPVTPDYVIGPGDEILVRLWGADSTNSQLTVDTAGNIYIPKVGAIQVAGLRYNELQQRVTAEVNHVFRNYRISISLGHLRSIQVYVVGEARRPGTFTVSGLSTVLNALFASGGPNVQGSMRNIQVRRTGQTIPTIDLYDLVLRGDKSRDVRLESGDTIFIPPVGPQVVMAGSVRHPAIYELKGDSALDDVLTLAGGFSATGTSSQIALERIEPDRARQVINVSLDAAGRAMVLRDGDIVFANHISAGYERSVTIRGNLANPGRFAWHAGMRLHEIIPDRRSLLTNDYWRERNQLGVPVPLFEPSEARRWSPEEQTAQSLGGRTRDEPYSRDFSLEGNRSLSDSSLGSRTGLSPDQASLDMGNNQPGLALGGVVAADTVGEQFGEQGNTNSIQQGSNFGSAAGNAPMQSRQTTRNTPTNAIRIPAPEINWSYAVIERLDPETLKSSLVPFNLGKLLQDHDASQDLELQAGDIVTILSQRDVLVPLEMQTKYVRLEGEFASAGVYSVHPEETLDQLVQRAGGFTSKAYLYGSSFQRESARVFQQQRLDEYITQLSADMERATAVRAASSPSGVLDPNALAEQRTLVSQLRQLRATGRVVLEFQPDSAGPTTVPKIALENGDVFRVPSRPNTVSVIGAVYGQNVFLYNPDRRLEDYLALAGKTNRIADKQHAFIIRADGSIYSRERAQGVLSNHFDAARVLPGDAIVIPEKLIKPTALRQFIDYSQILSSFGLAAAAINVVR